LTHSGRCTHKVVKQPSISLAQDKESPPARTDVLTTMPRHQHRTVTRTAGILAQSVKGAGCQLEPAIRPTWVAC